MNKFVTFGLIDRLSSIIDQSKYVRNAINYDNSLSKNISDSIERLIEINDEFKKFYELNK